MEKMLAAVQSRVAKIEAHELEQISKTSQDLAVQIALTLSNHPAPPLPEFPIDSKYEDASNLADIIDDTLSKEEGSNTYGETGSSNSKDSNSKYKDEEVPPVSEEEAIKSCEEWKKLYEVVIGVSWGKLPYDLQLKWMSYHCDSHLSSSNSNT